MAYFTLHAYDADVFLSSFAGLRQAEEMASDLRYALEAENVETVRGTLQPMADPVILDYEFGSRIETLAKFHRRYYTGSGSKDWLVVASGGNLYYKQDGNNSFVQLGFPSGVNAWQSNVWSYATYEINPAGAPSPVDVMLMSNAQDGMIIIKPPYTATVSNPDWKVDIVDTRADPTTGSVGDGPKFGIIERYAERIWGCGVPDEPDTLYYSRPYDPENWTDAQQNWSTPGQDEEQPEDIAGDIRQPSWDGDSFTGLKSFGSQLIAFKKHRVWRILGTDPGEYTFKEQFGGGTAYPNTVAIETERMFLLENDGLSVYDGLSVSPFKRPYIEKTWKTAAKSYFDQACAAIYKNKYYLAFPTGNSTVNNTLIVYNLEEDTFLLYTDVYIETMTPTEDYLYATSSTLPGKIMTIQYDSWEIGDCSNKNTKWATPWIDFSRKSVAKGGYEIYFNPEVKGAPVTFRFSIQTEKKTKSKNVTCPVTPFSAKQKRVRFGGTGRKFRLIIETTTHTAQSTWRLVGGIQMVVEIDPD